MILPKMMAAILASLTAMTFATSVRINADGTFTSLLGRNDGYQNDWLDSNDPKPPDETNGDPKNAKISDARI